MLATQLCPTVCDPMDRAMAFSRQEYWSGQPFPSPGNLSDPGIELGSSTLRADFLLSEQQGSPHNSISRVYVNRHIDICVYVHIHILIHMHKLISHLHLSSIKESYLPVLENQHSLYGKILNVYIMCSYLYTLILAVKNPPAMQEAQETQVLSLDQEDPLGEGNGNPLQYSCLDNPMDKGAWQATVHRVWKSLT